MQPLTCKELIDFLDDYLSGDLDPEARVAFDSHLANCRACRDYLQTYAETIRLARASSIDDDESVPADVPGELVKMVLDAARRR